MVLKKTHLLVLATLFFAVTFSFSFLLFGPASIEPGIPVKTLEQINGLSEAISEILEKKGAEKNTAIQNLIDSGEYGAFHLLYRDWTVKSFKSNEPRPKSNNSFFDKLDESQFSLSVPVGKDHVRGVIVVTRKMPPGESKSSHIAIQILFSLALTYLLLGLIIWIKARVLIKPIDRLCQQFTRYRREQETSEINLPKARLKQSPIERRVEILEDLWSRFQSIQLQLEDNIEALKKSEAEKENTIQALERAKVQERRLVELGHALAEFGHDIGNANGAIGTFVTLLLKTLEQDSISAMDLARCLTFIRRINIASTTVSGLTKDILDFAKGKTELRIGHHKLSECVAQLEVNLGFISDLPIDFDYPQDVELCLKIDDSKISRVIVNLVKNAWEKLEEEEGQIHVKFLPDDKSGITITVTDNGYPIPETILSNLFQPFQTAGKAQGTGLGLAICKKIIEGHGGKIAAENLPDKAGVRFSFYLPNCVTSLPEQMSSAPSNKLEISPSPSE
ncbi:MAG: HAMP domain-containing histidine kinase [SAR324 cluster bacterium]|nr:HAMP domain-containing histidine kinase [SAR324 cluster bacterium]